MNGPLLNQAETAWLHRNIDQIMVKVMAFELNLEGLPGPTHHFGGLSLDNIASQTYSQFISNPKKAALEVLAKMRKLHSLGIKQAILPPQERPFIPILKSLGYYGSDAQIIEQVAKSDLQLLMACSSSASMWTANAATVSPSADSNDGRIHFTPANLISQFHRSFEAPTTGLLLFRIFNHPVYFVHHHPLPYHLNYADEGAANHTRFCGQFDQPGVQLFVYGNSLNQKKQDQSLNRFVPRQTEEASKAIARLHRLASNRVVFAQQNPLSINAGVFHNDVISVGNQNTFLFHELAFTHTSDVIEELKRSFESQCNASFVPIEVKNSEISLEEAVKTYFFNSQLITLDNGSMALVAPEECRQSSLVSEFIHKLLQNAHQPIRQVIYQDVRESMHNGGGPACLRLRVVLKKEEYNAVHSEVKFTEELDHSLVKWVEKHYRDRLNPSDLADPELLIESRAALDELTKLLKLGPIYPFQQMQERLPPPLPEKRR